MSETELLDTAIESALYAFVAQRCERAYLHEMRNSVQTIYVSIDMLSRLISGKAPASLSGEKAVKIARRAVWNQEKTLTRLIKQLIVQREAPCAVDVDVALRQLAIFLSNDAVARDVTIQIATTDHLYLLARPSRFRVALLSSAIRAIDTMNGGGELRISASGTDEVATIQLSLLSADATALDESGWCLDAHPNPLSENWILNATQKLVVGDRGSFESSVETMIDRRCRVVRLSYQAAKSSSLECVESTEHKDPPPPADVFGCAESFD